MQFWKNAGDESWTGEEGILTMKDLGMEESLPDLGTLRDHFGSRSS